MAGNIVTAPQVHQDVVDAFTAQLPDDIRERLRITSALTYNLGVAVRDKGWSVPQLVHEATRDLDNVGSIGAIIHDRIKVCTTVGPARTAPHGRTKPKVHHGCCEDGFIYDETTEPVTITKCPGDRATTSPTEANA